MLIYKEKKMQPIHFGVFTLSTHDWDDPIREVLRYGKQQGVDILLPKMGEIVQVNQPKTIAPWFLLSNPED